MIESGLYEHIEIPNGYIKVKQCYYVEEIDKYEVVFDLYAQSNGELVAFNQKILMFEDDMKGWTRYGLC